MSRGGKQRKGFEKKRFPLKKSFIEQSVLKEDSKRKKREQTPQEKRISKYLAYLIIISILVLFPAFLIIQDDSHDHFTILRGKTTWGYVQGESFSQSWHSEILYVVDNDTLSLLDDVRIAQYRIMDSVMVLYDSVNVGHAIIPKGENGIELGLFKNHQTSYTYSERDYYEYMAMLEKLKNKHHNRKRFYYRWFD